MRKLMFCFLVFSFLISFVSAESNNTDVMVVKADIVESSVGVNVPSNVFFGSVTSGYISERNDIDITNTGTVDINVVPELEEINDTYDYFEYIGFRDVLDDPVEYIGEFEIEIEKPESVGSERDRSVYMYLDLSDYPGDIDTRVEDLEAEVIFWAFAI